MEDIETLELPRPGKTVIFACVHNAGRSQMAAYWFNHLADPKKARALSAGTEPAPQVHPVVVEAMKERGLDLSDAQPRKLTAGLASGAAYLATSEDARRALRYVELLRERERSWRTFSASCWADEQSTISHWAQA